MSKCRTDQNNPEDSKNVGDEANNLSSAAHKGNNSAQQKVPKIAEGTRGHDVIWFSENDARLPTKWH